MIRKTAGPSRKPRARAVALKQFPYARQVLRPTGRGAVFLDRDGVLVREVDYLCDPKELRLLPGAAAAAATLRAAGFKIVVITNQSAVARGYLSLRGLAGIHRRLKALLRQKGCRLDALYFCPHHPGAGARVRCRCRKPGIALLERAARRFKLDLSACYLVGDTTTDVRTARNAGCRAILVKTGYGGRDRRYKTKPEAVRRDLAEAAEYILRQAAA